MENYISNIELRNYRSCKKTTVELRKDLSALIGVNGSGKSSFLNGILLLKKMIRTPSHVNEDEFFQSSCLIKGTFIIDKKQLPFDILIKYITNEKNVDEVILAEQKWNFKEFTGIDQFYKVPINFFPRQLTLLDFNKKTTKSAENELNIFMFDKLLRSLQQNTDSPNHIKVEEISVMMDVIEKVDNFIKGISYYSASQFTDPSKCPTYLEIENDRVVRKYLSSNEHIQFMYDLYLAYKNPQSKFQEFLSIVGNEGMGLIDTIEYKEIDVPSNVYQVGTGGKLITKEMKKLLVIPNFIIHSTKLSPSQLSEGTFKTLAMVFYLINNNCSMLILEEPEVCIHHGLLASILELVKESSQDRQIIISTHSDYVLDELDPMNVYVVRNDARRGTIIKHIKDSLSAREYKALKDYLNTTGNLGEYWRNGDLEK